MNGNSVSIFRWIYKKNLYSSSLNDRILHYDIFVKDNIIYNLKYLFLSSWNGRESNIIQSIDYMNDLDMIIIFLYRIIFLSSRVDLMNLNKEKSTEIFI